MKELAFTKTFLSTLDARPVKLRYDHVVDPQSMPLRVPYTLPRLSPPHPPMPKKVKTTAAPGSSISVSVHLKSARNPVLEFAINNVSLSTTTVHDLRDAIRERVVAGDQPPPADKIKILYKKKPVSGSTEKTLSEILADSDPNVLSGGKTVEFGIMIMGGATARPTPTEAMTAESPEGAAARVVPPSSLPPNPAQGPSGPEVLRTDAFWRDLEEFLEQRIKDVPEALRLAGIFKRAWEAESHHSSI